MNCTENFLVINEETAREDVMEWLAQNYSYNMLALCFDDPETSEGRVVIRVENAKEFAAQYSDRPFFLSRINRLKLRVSIVNFEDFSEEVKSKVIKMIPLSPFSQPQTCRIIDICNALGLKERELHDYFIFDESTTVQEIRRLFAYDCRTTMHGHDLTRDHWHEILVMNSRAEWNEMTNGGNTEIGLEDVDKIVLDVYTDYESTCYTMKGVSVSEFCKEFCFKDESVKTFGNEEKNEETTSNREVFPKLTPKPGTRLCSWHNKKCYGYFHLFGPMENGEGMPVIGALIERPDGTMIWKDPTWITFED